MMAAQLIAQALGDAMMAAIQHKAQADEWRAENEKLRATLTQERLDAQLYRQSREAEAERLLTDIERLRGERDKLAAAAAGRKTTKP